MSGKKPTPVRRRNAVGTLMLAVASMVVVFCSGSSRAYQISNDLSGADRLLITFAGKGTMMAWDVGVTRAAFEELEAVQQGRVIVSGSSSGAVLAAAMSCRGFSVESIKFIEDEIKKFSRKIVDESKAKNLMVLLGLPTEADHSSLDRLLDVVLDGEDCTPKVPLLIPAGNFEVLDVRSNQPLRGKTGRNFHITDFTVSEGNRNLGKVCTYFIDPQMMAFLQNVPRDELLCDLRLVETNAELRMAVLASVSEPTYFHPFADPDPKKIIRSGHEDPTPPTRRSYWGGAIMDVPIQDIKRALPALYSFSTGRAPFMMMVDKLMSNLSLTEITPLAARSKWWLDLEATMTAEEAARLEKPQFDFPEQIKAGYDKAKECLASDHCQPEDTIAPENTKSPVNHPSGINGDLKAWTKRGLRELR